MAEGKLRPNPGGKYSVNGNQSGGGSREPMVRFVTPLAQDVELAKSELRDNVYKGQTVCQLGTDGKGTCKKRKAETTHTKAKRSRKVNDRVWSER